MLIPGFVNAIREGHNASAAAGREFDLIRIIATTDRANLGKTPQDIEYTP